VVTPEAPRNIPSVTYEDFVAGKRLLAPMAGISEPDDLSPALFPFQSDIARWALRRGRAAIWADCGLGKSWMALEWSRSVAEHTRRPVLILTPLAVAQQFVREGSKMDTGVTHVCEARDVRDGINVCNYERLHKLDPSAFGGVVLDESSILKDYTSSTRNALIDSFSRTPFRLACTATPAPNDHMELGNHAEFLGVMSRTEMLSMFFVHDGGSTQDWRIKGHAQKDFWRWICSWAVAIRSPSDMGYEASRFVLPPLNVRQHVVSVGTDFARQQGSLFVVEARGLCEQREARKRSMADRVKLTAEIVKREPNEPWLIWCDLNDESTALVQALPDAVEIRGSDDSVDKESRMMDFIEGRSRILVTKPSIAGFGVNLQHCARTVFVGLSHSFEAWYQAIRRVYRFGQRRPVECHVVTSDGEGAVVANLQRKQADAARMVDGMVREMTAFADVRAAKRDFTEYNPTREMTVPVWVGSETR
jgi:hypothetical protein